MSLLLTTKQNANIQKQLSIFLNEVDLYSLILSHELMPDTLGSLRFILDVLLIESSRGDILTSSMCGSTVAPLRKIAL